MSARVVVYTTSYCPYCVRATGLLRDRGIAYREVDVTGDADARRWLREASGRHTVPQIFIDDRPIGGYDDLAALDKNGTLNELLAKRAPC
jgi:glutaredoxin 3